MKPRIIYLTGALQILGAIGLLVPRTRRLAGICLALLLVAMFPGNVYAAINEIQFRGDAPTPLWLRTPIQLFFIGMVLWTSIGTRSSEVGQRLTEGRLPSTSSPPGKAHRREHRFADGQADHAVPPARVIRP